MIIYAGEASKRFGVAGFGIGLGVILAIGASIIAAFWLTGPITRILGRIGMIVVVRVLGLILCAMAVQFILAGIAGATTGLMRPEFLGTVS